MPSVVIHRPGTVTDYTYHNPDTGQDEAMIEWSFTATVDGSAGVVSAVFPIGTSESGAAGQLQAQLSANPGGLGGVASTGGGGGSAGGSGPGPVGSGVLSSGGGGDKKPDPDRKHKTKTADGT